jgi:transposase
LIEKKPISFSVVGRVLQNDGKKFYRWYKEVLSGFQEKEQQIGLHSSDVIEKDKIDRETGELSVIAVPILNPENFGEDMALDDKNIGGEGYTILSNKKTGKIAFLAQTTKASMLAEILEKVPVVLRYSVKTISKDLAEGYDWIARTMFLNAIRIDDKFHVLKLGFEALQNVRIRFRQEFLNEERRKREEKKMMEREAKFQAEKNGERYHRKLEAVSKPKTYENGDTKKELLARSRYLLFQFEKTWSKSQKERGAILFREFPEIAKAYKLMINFRGFYQVRIGDTLKAKKILKDWYQKISESNIEEMATFGSTVLDHEGTILNYFETGQTNAFAESLNSQIQRFVQSNAGTNDRDFFHFRLKGYFS